MEHFFVYLRKASLLNMPNTNLNAAIRNREDEFYTQLPDIEKELRHYRKHFNGKTVFCNCDDCRVSNFSVFFVLNFRKLGLKRLITTCYRSNEPDLWSQNSSERAVYAIYDGFPECNTADDAKRIEYKEFDSSDGSFQSKESIELLKQSDIVVTNPPFSLFKEFIAQLMQYNKKFIIIGNQNAIKYKEIFPYFKKNKIWLGYGFGDMKFKVPDYYAPRATRYWVDEDGQKWRSLGNICWFTNLDIAKRNEALILFRQYDPEKNPQYDNYPAIEVSKVADIPCDYFGEMGVPITFMDKYCPEQFDIIGTSTDSMSKGAPYINGNRIYERLLIRRKQ